MARKKSKSKKAAKKYQIELTPLSLFLWGGCSFFVLAWIFALGILVGHGLKSGKVIVFSDLRGQINTLWEMVSRDKSRDLRSPSKSEPDPKLAFYEELSTKKEAAKRGWTPEGGIESPGGEASPKKTKAPHEALFNREPLGPKKEMNKKQNEMPEELQRGRKKSGRVDALYKQPRPSTPKIQYTLQLASLGDKKEAEKMIKDLVGRGYAAYFYEVKVKGKTYYRVRCGRFTSWKEAGDYAKKLAREEGIKGFVSRLE